MLTIDHEPPPLEHRSAELTRPLRLSRLAIVSAVAVTAGMFAMLGLGIGPSSLGVSRDAPPARVELSNADVRVSGAAGHGRQIAIMPDGSAVVYLLKTDEGENAFAYQQLDSEEPVIIRESESLMSPEITGNGRQIIGMGPADETSGPVRFRLPTRGGTPSPVGNDADPRQTALEAEGLRVQQMMERKALVVRARPGAESGRAAMRDLETGKETPILSEDVVEMRYAAGYVVFVRADGSLWAAPFDEKRNRITAAPVKAASNVSLTGSGIAQLAVSPNGNVAYVEEGLRSLAIVSRAGRLRNATPELRLYSNPRFSADGRRVAVDFYEGDGRDVWTVALDSGRLTRATFGGDGHDAAWTPDGQHITYTSFRLGALGIYRSQPGSRTAPDSVFTDQRLVNSGEWLKDGSGIVATAADLEQGSRLDLAIVSNKGRGPLVPIVANEFETRFPAISRDGRWLAYVSDESGTDEVYVRRLIHSASSLRVSSRGGTEPVWSPDGKELFYRDAWSQYLIAASLRVDSIPVLIERRALFPMADMVAGFTRANYDISPDGQTFVLVRRSVSSGITVLQNLPAMLRDSR